MNARPLISHLVVALVAFGLAYVVFSRAGEHRSLERPSDPVVAFTDALKVAEPHARAQALLDFFAVADPAWAERLRAEVAQEDGSKIELDELSETLFASWWARTDPDAAFEQRVDPAWTNRHPWLREVMRAWVERDQVRAAEATGKLPPNPDRGRVEALRVLVEHWWDKPVSTDVAPLLNLIAALPVTARAAAIQRLIETSIQKRGIDATEAFVEAIPQQEAFDLTVQQEMLARYGQALVDHDLARAKSFALKHGQGRDGSGILRHLAFSWGAKDGPAAMDWAMNLPDTPERPGVVMRVWLSYRNAKSDEAGEWLISQEPSLVLEGVFQRFLTGTASVDASAALEIASRTKDPALRERLLAAVGVGWMKADRAAAEKWLDTVELAPELEERVRSAPVVVAPPMQAQPSGG